VASSDGRAGQVDEIQYGHDEGPCLRSLATGQVVVIDDLADDDRWGDYRVRAPGHGVRSSLSLPLRAAGTVIRALNIYASTPLAFGPADQLVARRFAEEASRALELAVRMAERTEMSMHLQAALASRAVIDQTLGIIMEAGRALEANRPFAEPRHELVAATPALRERELAKHASLADAVAEALQQRGVPARLAELAARTGWATYRHAVQAWNHDPAQGLDVHLRQAFDDLRTLTCAPDLRTLTCAP
jgi:hypothetical protein